MSQRDRSGARGQGTGNREQKAEGRRQKAEGSCGESVAAVSIQNRVPHPEGTLRSKIQNPEPPNPQSPSAWPRPLQQRLQQHEPYRYFQRAAARQWPTPVATEGPDGPGSGGG